MAVSLEASSPPAEAAGATDLSLRRHDRHPYFGRQSEIERGAAAGFRLDPNAAAISLDNTLTDGYLLHECLSAIGADNRERGLGAPAPPARNRLPELAAIYW